MIIYFFAVRWRALERFPDIFPSQSALCVSIHSLALVVFVFVFALSFELVRHVNFSLCNASFYVSLVVMESL